MFSPYGLRMDAGNDSGDSNFLRTQAVVEQMPISHEEAIAAHIPRRRTGYILGCFCKGQWNSLLFFRLIRGVRRRTSATAGAKRTVTDRCEPSRHPS